MAGEGDEKKPPAKRLGGLNSGPGRLGKSGIWAVS